MSDDKKAAAMHDTDASIGEVQAPVPEVPEAEREPVETWELRRDIETFPGDETVQTFGKGEG